MRIWACQLLEAKPFMLVAVALADKLARIVFAVLRTGGTYSGRVVACGALEVEAVVGAVDMTDNARALPTCPQQQQQ